MKIPPIPPFIKLDWHFASLLNDMEEPEIMDVDYIDVTDEVNKTSESKLVEQHKDNTSSNKTLSKRTSSYIELK